MFLHRSSANASSPQKAIPASLLSNRRFALSQLRRTPTGRASTRASDLIGPPQLPHSPEVYVAIMPSVIWSNVAAAIAFALCTKLRTNLSTTNKQEDMHVEELNSKIRNECQPWRLVTTGVVAIVSHCVYFCSSGEVIIQIFSPMFQKRMPPVDRDLFVVVHNLTLRSL